MNTKSMRRPMSLLLVLVSVVVVFGTAVLATQDVANALPPNNAPWTTTGSTGIVDEADTAIVNIEGPTVAVVPTPLVLPAVLDMRYNVVAVADIYDDQGNCKMLIRYRDNGPQAQVLLRLRQFDLSTGNTTNPTTRAQFNSNNAPQTSGPNFATETINACRGNPLDFVNNAYFIDAIITKNNATGDAAIGAIQIEAGAP